MLVNTVTPSFHVSVSLLAFKITKFKVGVVLHPPIPFCVKSVTCQHVQWNLYSGDTLGTKVSVP